MDIKFKRLSPNGWIPTKVNKSDLGFDLRSTNYYVIPPYETIKIKTEIACGFPQGYGGLILDRSSMGVRGIKVMAGVIDNGYTGELVVCLLNTYKDEFNIHPGDKIAQLVLIPSPEVAIIEVDQLGETDRGNKGFGSSGA